MQNGKDIIFIWLNKRIKQILKIPLNLNYLQCLLKTNILFNQGQIAVYKKKEKMNDVNNFRILLYTKTKTSNLIETMDFIDKIQSLEFHHLNCLMIIKSVLNRQQHLFLARVKVDQVLQLLGFKWWLEMFPAKIAKKN